MSDKIDELDEILVEFALKARALIDKNEFWDKKGKPSEGAKLIEETDQTLRAYIAQESYKIIGTDIDFKRDPQTGSSVGEEAFMVYAQNQLRATQRKAIADRWGE